MAEAKEDKTSNEEPLEVNESETSEVQEKKSPIKLITRIVLLISVLFFVWYITSERHTPYTDQARIQGLITPVTPRVSGNVTKINVRLHQKVKKGDTIQVQLAINGGFVATIIKVK